MDEEYAPEKEKGEWSDMDWFLIAPDNFLLQFWNELISILIIYSLILAPLVLVNPQIFADCNDGNYRDCESVTKGQSTLFSWDLIVDCIFFIDILAKFFQANGDNRTMRSIVCYYFFTTFVFDVIATLPSLIMSWDNLDLYWLKLFRLIHFAKITRPLELFCDYAL